ncbi:MAG: DUF2177 family protein [Hyphomicrobiaceae bacterium]
MTRLRSSIVAYAAVLVAFALIDSIWIALVAAPMFRAAVGTIMLDEPFLAAAVPFYLIYAAGIVALAVRPALDAGSPGRAAWNGTILGLTAYGTFEFTSLAIFKGWTWGLVAVDIAWGAALSALVSMFGYHVTRGDLGRAAAPG